MKRSSPPSRINMPLRPMIIQALIERENHRWINAKPKTFIVPKPTTWRHCNDATIDFFLYIWHQWSAKAEDIIPLCSIIQCFCYSLVQRVQRKALSGNQSLLRNISPPKRKMVETKVRIYLFHLLFTFKSLVLLLWFFVNY